MPGPAARPAHLKLLNGRSEGTDSGGRKVKHGPAFDRVAPQPPEDLSTEARAEWDRVVPGLSRLQLLKPEDRAMLTTYCEAWATFTWATAELQQSGLFVEAKQGLIPHPAVGIQRASAKEVRAIAAHFGLSPSTEQALARSEDGDNDGGNPFG